MIDTLAYIFCFFPLILPIGSFLALYFIKACIARQLWARYWRIALGIFIFILTALAVFVTPSGAYLADVLMIINMISAIVGTFVTVAILQERLAHHHKRTLQMFGVVFSLLLCAIPIVRDVIPAEIQTRCELQTIAQSLKEYHLRYGGYPDTLANEALQRLPDVQKTLRHRFLECQSRWRNIWLYVYYNYASAAIPPHAERLYIDQEDTYVLGIAYKPRWIGWVSWRVCHYNVATDTISCGFNNWGPFAPP